MGGRVEDRGVIDGSVVFLPSDNDEGRKAGGYWRNARADFVTRCRGIDQVKMCNCRFIQEPSVVFLWRSREEEKSGMKTREMVCEKLAC